ncbi:hypothetical protein M3576_01575 [Weizmannia ginsengihumi]|nr:hypothetical protein [Heyndrickxia ginsengihumi]
MPAGLAYPPQAYSAEDAQHPGAKITNLSDEATSFMKTVILTSSRLDI